MNMILMIKNYKNIAIGILCLIVGIYIYSVYAHINSLESELVVMTANNIKLTDSIEQQKIVLERKISEIKQIKNINVKLLNSIDIQSNKINNLINKFSKTANDNDRDLGKLAIVKPKLISNIVTKASVKMNRCFEIIAGSIINENEFNSECPELFEKD